MLRKDMRPLSTRPCVTQRQMLGPGHYGVRGGDRSGMAHRSPWEGGDDRSYAERLELTSVAAGGGIRSAGGREDDSDGKAAPRCGEGERRRELVEHAESVGPDQENAVGPERTRQLEVGGGMPEWRKEPARSLDDGDRSLVLRYPALDQTEVDANASYPSREVGGDRFWEGVERGFGEWT
jgi:hypothetical protein